MGAFYCSETTTFIVVEAVVGLKPTSIQLHVYGLEGRCDTPPSVFI